MPKLKEGFLETVMSFAEENPKIELHDLFVAMQFIAKDYV